MILTHVLGNLADYPVNDKQIDYLSLDYTDAQKHLLRAVSQGGRDIALRLSPEAQLRGLQDGDILADEDDTIVVIQILPTMSLLAKPRDFLEAAHFCYEIGNRHAPLYAYPQGDTVAFVVLCNASMELLFQKLGVPYEKKAIKLEEGYRMKLLMGTHHHHEAHAHG